MSQGFGEGLWKNLQGVQLGKDGGLEAPVRADGEHGIVIGADAIAKAAEGESARPTPMAGRMKTRLRRLFRRH